MDARDFPQGAGGGPAAAAGDGEPSPAGNHGGPALPGGRAPSSPRMRGGLRWAAAFLLSWLCVLGITVDLGGSTPEEVARYVEGAHGVLYTVVDVLCSFPPRSASVQLCVFAILLAGPVRRVWLGGRDPHRDRVSSRAVWLLSVLLSVAAVVGMCMDGFDSLDPVTGGPSQIARGLIVLAGWLVFSRVVWTYLFSLADRARARLGATRPGDGHRLLSRLLALLDAHPLLPPLAVLVIAWAPYLAGYAPGLFMWDTATQILQWFGYPNNASDYLNLIDPSVILTQHHPPLSTALIGTCVRAGILIAGDENVGVLLFAILQFSLLALSCAWGLAALGRLGVDVRVRAAALLFLAIVPVFGCYSVTLTKDVLFSAALLSMVMCLAVYLGGPGPWRRRDAVLLAAASMGTALLRNGGWLVAAAGLVLAAAVARGRAARERRSGADAAGAAPRRWRAPLGIAIAVVACQFCLTGIVYPALKITPGSVREALSIPFQQTARFFREHAGEIPEDEYEAVADVLDAADLAELYRPSKSDPVKNTFNEDAGAAELLAYARVWVAELARDPVCYLEAWLADYYGYLYIGGSNSWTYTPELSEEVMEGEKLASHFSFHRLGGELSRHIGRACSAWRVLFQNLPVLTLLMSAAVYVWALVAACAQAVRTRAGWLAPVLVPGLLVLAMALAGPCNATTYFRYVLPIAIMAPFLLAIACFGRAGAASR